MQGPTKAVSFHMSWESLALLQGSFGPFGPKVANRVRKWVPGPSRPRGPKSPKRSRKKNQNRLFFNFLALFRLRFGLLGPGAGRARELIFELFLQLSARRAQMTPVAGKRFRNTCPVFTCSVRCPFLEKDLGVPKMSLALEQPQTCTGTTLGLL